MTTASSLKQIERKAYRDLFCDGLIDIGLGIWMIISSLMITTDNSAMAAIPLVVMIPIWQRLRATLTIPRVGEAKFRLHSKYLRLGLMMVAMFLTLGLGITLAVTRGEGPRAMEDFIAANPHLLFGAVLAFLICCLGAVFRVPRLFAYAALLIAAFAWGDRVGLVFPYSMTAVGLTVVVWGFGILTHFLLANPIIDPIPDPPDPDA